MNIGIIGLGHIAEKMANTINKTEDVKLYAVASRDYNKALEFKNRFHGEVAYGSYKELMEDSLVDLVYIATPHSFHYEQMLECLKQNKPVLCEKIFTTSSYDTSDIYKKFEEKNLYVSEALWTSFMPSVDIIRNIIDSNKIGNIIHMEASFFYSVMYKERIRSKALGGGAAMDLGVYPVSFILRTLGLNYDEFKILFIEKTMDENVDSKEELYFRYGNITALAHVDGNVTGSQEVIITGDKGEIHINSVNNPSLITVYDNSGNVLEEMNCASSYGGLEYEVIASMKAIENHKTEASEWNHEASIKLSKIMDEITK